MKQLLLICLVFLFCGISGGMADNALPLDSLYREMEKGRMTPTFLAGNDLLLKEAERQGNDAYKEKAYYAYVHYYCSNYNDEEAHKWLAKLEAITVRTDDCLLLYMGKYMMSRVHCSKGDLGIALVDAENLYKDALSLNNRRCMDIACLSIANVYIITGRYEEVRTIVRSVLDNGEKMDMSSPLHGMALCYLCYVDLCLKDASRAKVDLELLERYVLRGYYVNDVDKDAPDIPFISQLSHIDLCRGYVGYYLLVGLPSHARQYLQILKELMPPSPDKSNLFSWHDISITYYLAVGEYDNALVHLDELIALSREAGDARIGMKAIYRKVTLLTATGKSEEAVMLYHQLNRLRNKVDDDGYARHLGMFNAQMQAKIIEQENSRLKVRKTIQYGWIFFLLLLCSCLVVGFFLINRLKKRLEAAKRKAENSERLKSMFLANMNHEIRTPLNAIAGFSGLLMDEVDPEICKQYAEIVKDSNELLVRLINDVLDISKIEAGTITFSYSDVSLPSLMKSVYQTMRLRVEPPVELVSDPVEELTLYADRDRLMQVITNFLANACKHTTSGTIRFGYEEMDGKVYFYVKDTGEGIPEESRKDIFTRFVQGSGRKGGVGLGLALCRGFVTAMGGEIGVDSEVGKGSTFWFTLPLR